MTKEEEYKNALNAYMNLDVHINKSLRLIGISAIKKQIPQKSMEIKEYEYGTFYRLDFMCPTCDTPIIGQPYRPNYCKHCGQALDWSDGHE